LLHQQQEHCCGVTNIRNQFGEKMPSEEEVKRVLEETQRLMARMEARGKGLTQPTKLSAADYYKRAQQALASTNLDLTIRELDACLCSNPSLRLAVIAYYNIAAAIWGKFRFDDRKGDSVGDDEYIWVNGCNVCSRRGLRTYHQLPRDQQLDSSIIELHQVLNQLVSRTMTYGAYVYRHGQREFRAVSGLPPLRCLRDVQMEI